MIAFNTRKLPRNIAEENLLSLSASTDGVALFNSSRQSLWAIQLYAHFIKPNDRYIPQNMIVVALYVGKEKPNMQDFFYPLMKEMRQIIDDGGFQIIKNNKTILCIPR